MWATTMRATAAMSVVCVKNRKRERKMRIVKLSKKEGFFNRCVHFFFEKEIREDGEFVGRFRIKKGRIDKRNFKEGERLIFTFDSEVVYLSIAESGIIENDDNHKKAFPSYFSINVDKIYCVKNLTLSDLEKQIQKIYPGKNILISRGWPIIEENEKTKKLWNNLIKQSVLIR